MNTTRTITHDSNHTDIETYMQDADGVWMWAVTQCNGGLAMTDKITTSLVPYKFEYAMSRLKDAIDYAVQTGEFEGVRLWAMNVEESHNAEVSDMKAELKSADEGLKLFHSIASNGEQSVLSRLDGKADEVDAVNWQDEPTIEDITVNGYAFNSNHAKIENDMRQKLADEYNKLFAR